MRIQIENLARVLATVLSVQALLTGCATMQSKLAAEDQMGHPYSGVTLSTRMIIKCVWQLPAITKEKEGTSYFMSVPVSFLIALVYLGDLPLSLVGDTLFLPFDLAMEPQYRRWSVTQPCLTYQIGTVGAPGGGDRPRVEFRGHNTNFFLTLWSGVDSLSSV